jgi:hypothetical protein
MSSAGSTLASISRRKATKSCARCCGLQRAWISRGDVQRREEVERPVPNVVMRASLGLSDVHRQDRWRPLEGLDLGFLVEREHHRIRGRIYIQAHDVPFSMSCESGEILNDSVTWGLRPNVRQMRPIVVWLMPAFAAIVRVLQWVSPQGRRLKGLHDHRLDVLIRDRSWRPHAGLVVEAVEPPVEDPGCRSSCRSATSRVNRRRHLPTVAFVVRNRRATALAAVPSAHASTTRVRNARERFTRACFVNRVSALRSSSVTTIAGVGCPIFAMPL